MARKLYKIKFIKDTELCKVGDIKETSKKNAESAIKEGYAEVYNSEKQAEQEMKSMEKEYKNTIKEMQKLSIEEINSKLDLWAKDWDNPVMNLGVMQDMKETAKKSDFSVSELKELIKPILKQNKLKEKVFRLDQQFIDYKKTLNERLTQEQALFFRDKFIIDKDKEFRHKGNAIHLAGISEKNFDLIIYERNKPKEKPIKQPKLTQEQKKEIAIQKEEEKQIGAKQKGFAFSHFNMFTNFLDIAKEFWKIQPFFYDSHRIWWLWNNLKNRWEKVDEVDLLNAIDDNTENPTTDSSVKYDILEAMKRIGRRKKPKEPEHTWIQFLDEIYDIKTDKKFKATPEFFITNPLPWKLSETDETPIIDKIFKEWVVKEGIQDESYIKTIQEIMAYCLLSYMPIHRVFCFIGEGLNGKGSFLRLMEKLVGEDNICATELEILSSNRFESNKLFKKLICSIGEVDKGIFKKTKTLKSLTGEDLVRIEFKGKDAFDTRNYAKPLIATNHLPETSDKTIGFYRRWTIVDFPNIFNENKNIIEDIPNIEYNNFCRKSIKIIKELLERGEFINDGSIEQREDKYEKHSNYINEFVKLYCELNSDCWVEFSDFCEKYNEYLIGEGLLKKSKIEIGRAILLKGFVKKVKKVMVAGGYGSNETTKVCVFGLKWRDDVGLTV